MNTNSENIKTTIKSRVHICLVDHPGKRLEINEILIKIRDKFRGVTHSRMRYKKIKKGGKYKYLSDSVYRGHWFSDEKQKYIVDPINIIFVDIDTSKEEDYLSFFLKLQNEIRRTFNESEAWITFSNVTRVH